MYIPISFDMEDLDQWLYRTFADKCTAMGEHFEAKESSGPARSAERLKSTVSFLAFEAVRILVAPKVV